MCCNGDSVPNFSDFEKVTAGLITIANDQERQHSDLFEALTCKETKKGHSIHILLKEFGIENFNHFSLDYLPCLYSHVVLGDDCPLWLKDVAVEHLMQHQQASKSLMISVGNLICRLLPTQFHRRSALGKLYMTFQESHLIDAPTYGIRDLFLWALLSYRLELAMDIFNNAWPEYDRPSLVGASLTACKLLDKLASIAMEASNEVSLQLHSSARKYKRIANYITSQCFEEDRQKTRQMVLHRQLQWGNESFLITSSLLEGDESESFRDVLNDLWSGKLKYTRHMTLKLVLAICPLFAFVLDLPEQRRVKWYNFPAKWRAYYTAPITKFMNKAIFFTFHLLAFSYFLITDFHHCDDWKTMHICEKLVLIWVFGLTIEELRQLITEIKGSDVRHCLSNVWKYYTSSWNSVDWAMLLTFYSGFILRLNVDEDHFYIPRMLYTVSLITMYFRILRFATVWQYLGPKVEMIKQMMMQDLPPFLMIFFVYIVSFGIAYRVLLYPNDVLSRNTIVAIFAVPYWQLFGNLQLDMTEASVGCTRNRSQWNSDPDVVRCPETENYPLFVPFLVALFMIMSNILLLNIVIAVFNQTYGKVEKESSKVHRANLYNLVEEYIARPVLPSPLNIVESLLIRPLATLLICLYWTLARQDFHWRPHCSKLFRLLMAGKEVDPSLWHRVREERSYKFTRRISETIDKFQVLDQAKHQDKVVIAMTERQTIRNYQVNPQRIQEILVKLNNTEKELRTLLAELGRNYQGRRDGLSSLSLEDETTW